MSKGGVLWSSKPEFDPLKYRLIRVKPGKPFKGICTSHHFVGAYTHYTPSTKTTPCMAADCELCRQGCQRRWYCYVGVFSPASFVQGVLEMTERGQAALATHFEQYASLRGALLQAQRTTKRDNSPLDVQTFPGPNKDLPPEIDVQGYLLHMWRVSPDGPTGPSERQPTPAQVAAAFDGRDQLRPAVEETINSMSDTRREELRRELQEMRQNGHSAIPR